MLTTTRCALAGLAILLCLQQCRAQVTGHSRRTFEIGEDAFLLDGKPFQIRCGELHSTRVPREYWQHRLQMCKAMGLNTVCAYLFWNFHERQPGEFTWDGRADVAEFCRLAQKEGLWVILRPGPYACAEWEMGGLPWWLLKHKDIQLRSRDPRFLEAARAYLKEVGRVLGPLQVTQGGPILMVQAENEYGFYASDAAYMGEIRQALLDAGFEVPLFDCNPVWQLKNGYREDLFSVVNFGSNPKGGFAALRKIMPKGPLMCGEYYSGWFDTWGNPHHTGDTGRYLSELEYMLDVGASFSIYMAHGGTSFGFWGGADRPFKPDTSCYDYDAPISEAGWVTPKFERTRELFSRYLQEGETLPEPPAPKQVIAVQPIELTDRAALLDHLPEPLYAETPGNFEDYDLAQGCMLYRTLLPAGPAGRLSAAAVHDAAWISLDGKPIGVMDRRKRLYEVNVPAREEPQRLDILVNAMGRVNFGKEVHDRKGMHGPVKLQVAGKPAQVLTGWDHFKLPLDTKMLGNLAYEASKATVVGPAFYRASFKVESPGDTFLDMRNWGKGVAWVNGHCLGRYWNIGPSQTMYLPGVWLHAEENEVVVLDLLGPTTATLSGLKEPIMSELRPDLDFAGPSRSNRELALSEDTLVREATFERGDKSQTIRFDQSVSGRYFCLETLNAYGGQPFAAVAELDLLDSSGSLMSHEGWLIAHVTSEERIAEDGTAENAIDGQTANHWHTQWKAKQPKHPHRLVIDLGETRTLTGFRYVPRAGSRATIGGRIKDYRIYVGDQIVKD